MLEGEKYPATTIHNKKHTKEIWKRRELADFEGFRKFTKKEVIFQNYAVKV